MRPVEIYCNLAGSMIILPLSFHPLSSIEADSSERTGLIVGDALLALIGITAATVTVVLTLLTWWKHGTRGEDGYYSLVPSC